MSRIRLPPPSPGLLRALRADGEGRDLVAELEAELARVRLERDALLMHREVLALKVLDLRQALRLSTQGFRRLRARLPAPAPVVAPRAANRCCNTCRADGPTGLLPLGEVVS